MAPTRCPKRPCFMDGQTVPLGSHVWCHLFFSVYFSLILLVLHASFKLQLTCQCYGGPQHIMSCVMRKCALRSLWSSYSKKDWQVGSHQSFFGNQKPSTAVGSTWSQTFPDYWLCCLRRLYFVVGVIPKEGLVGGCDNGKNLESCFPMTQLKYSWPL